MNNVAQLEHDTYNFGTVISALGGGDSGSRFGDCIGGWELMLNELGDDILPPPNLILSFCKGGIDGDSSRDSFSDFSFDCNKVTVMNFATNFLTVQ